MRRPEPLLAATVAVQWLVTAGVALTAERTEGIYGNTAAARAVVAGANGVADGVLPPTGGPVYPLLLAPLVALTDDVGNVASVATTLNVVVLAPVASYCLLALARGIAGRRFAVLAATIWLLAPVVATPLFVASYQDVYANDVLPALYGLTLGPVYLAMVLSVVAASVAMRATTGARNAALVAGLLAALAAATLPVAGAVAVGMVLALAASRRLRGLLEAATGLAVGLMPALLWRHQTPDGVSLTLGHPSWKAFEATMAEIREFFWSNRLLQWIPVAGAVGALRLALPAAALLAGWFGASAIVVAATPSNFADGRFFVELIPSWPAYALLAAATPALVPTLTRRFAARLEPERSRSAVPNRVAGAAIVLIAIVPLVLVALVAR